MKTTTVLVINPGSTSTKIGFFEGEESVFTEVIRHNPQELADNLADQYLFRMNLIETILQEKGTATSTLHAVIGIGGFIKPGSSGTYQLNARMVQELSTGKWGVHASNLGGMIAYHLGQKWQVPAYISDPVVVDEFEPIARISGHPLFERRSIFHALNQKAIAKRYALEQACSYHHLNLVVAHMGGGISVAAHQAGRVIDSNNALNGDGAFTPQRSGGLPAGQLIDACFSGEYTKEQLHKMLVGQGGLVAYFGIDSTVQLEKKRDSDSAQGQHIDLILRALAYQVAKEIGAYATVLKGQVHGILLTGGIAHSPFFTDLIKDHVSFIAPVHVYPGEDEMTALNQCARRVLSGKEKAILYDED